MKLDNNVNYCSNDFDLLTGKDVYWNITSGNLKRDPLSGGCCDNGAVNSCGPVKNVIECDRM